MRLDLALVERGFSPTRARAQANVMAGKILVNGKIETKSGHQTRESDEIKIIEDSCPYVSRGGLKLKAALAAFGINPKNKICLDVGVSTGGFTDCLIKEGAQKVFAVDVGRGQIDCNLLKNPHVVFIPQTNARYLKSEIFPQKPELAVIDVSFISLKLVLGPVINCLARPSEIVALIKPQFELTPRQVPRGIVKEESYRLSAVEGLKSFLSENKLGKTLAVIPSPITGAKGNVEYLWHISA
ncbi:MAG: TlyA family RNA methyltransferase [Elusimicrobia bacterium]|nr:TlyA family RNA methyltransferase [Elusimicrobiota bacterium]